MYNNLKYDFFDTEDVPSVKERQYHFRNIEIEKLNNLSKNNPMLKYIVLLACFNISFFRLNGQKTLHIVIPSFTKAGKHGLLIGEFPQTTLKNYLSSLKNNLETLKYLDTINNENLSVSFNGINNISSDMLDLSFEIDINEQNNININAKFRSMKYKESTVESIINGANYILTTFLSDTDVQIDSLMKIFKYEMDLINSFNNTFKAIDNISCLHYSFIDYATKNPNQIALIENGQTMTYGELDKISNSLGRYLLSKGINAGDIIAILNTRTIYTIVSIIAILKIGAAYAPVDANYPLDRIQLFLNNSCIKNIVTTEQYLTKTYNMEFSKNIIVLDQDWKFILRYNDDPLNIDVNLENLAYVIFTSGSTGVPKTASLKHIGWSNLLDWFTEKYNITDSDRVYLISSISFDISQRSIFMALKNGATLYLNNDVIYDPERIADYLYDNRLTIINYTPSGFYPIIDSQEDDLYKKLKFLRCVFLAGETISPQRLINWTKSEFFNSLIVNIYGVAECTDVSSSYNLDSIEKYLSSYIPIGYPINNNSLLIVDENKELLPPNAIGEICITGIGLGGGYINDRKLTDEKFVVLKNGDKAYLTGDIGKFTNDYVEFYCRKDYQVKIRGNRVELGDIENAMRQITYIQEASVIMNNSQELHAYIELRNTDTDTSDSNIKAKIFSELRSKLPQYMIPDNIIIVNKLPINANGKVDRIALQKLTKSQTDSIDANDNNEGATLERIHKIACELLKIDEIDVHENLFNHGMHSILVTNFIANIRKHCSVKLSPIDVYTNPSIYQLHMAIKNK